MARARRALVEHELAERRFDLFQRKAWFWILAATTIASTLLTIALVLWSGAVTPIGVSAATSLAAGVGAAHSQRVRGKG